MATFETGRVLREATLATAGAGFAGRFQSLAHQSIV
jgi:hypothetical protein